MRYRGLDAEYTDRIAGKRSITVRVDGLRDCSGVYSRRGINHLYRIRKPLKRVDRPHFINWVTVNLTGSYLEGMEPKPIKYVETYTHVGSSTASESTMGWVMQEIRDGEIPDDEETIMHTRIRWNYDVLLDQRKRQKRYTKKYCRLVCAWFGVKIK